MTPTIATASLRQHWRLNLLALVGVILVQTCVQAGIHDMFRR